MTRTAHTTASGGAKPRRRRSSAGATNGALSWGITWAVLGLLVIMPLAAVGTKAAEAGPQGMLASVTSPIAIAALGLSFGGALLSAVINMVTGTLVAWALVRYDFWGRSIANAVVDLPFALPTAVAGITLSELLGPEGWIGSLSPALAVAYRPAAVLIAMTFVSVPFTVRAVQPVLQELEPDVEEAAALLGAGPWRTFTDVILPAIRPAMLTGLALAFARSVGEFGSVVIVSGNIPLSTLTGPVLIFQRIEEYNAVAATSIAIVMLAVSLLTLLVIGALQARGRSRG